MTGKRLNRSIRFKTALQAVTYCRRADKLGYWIKIYYCPVFKRYSVFVWE